MQKQILKFLVALCLSTIFVAAQQPQGAGEHDQLPSHVQRLNRVPVNQEILKVKLPHPKEVQLPNGLALLVLEQHRLPTVSITLWIKSGALSDPKDLPGLASFTADLLRDGTSKRSGTQIAAELDEIGATFNANAGSGSSLTSINASGLGESVDKLLDLMSDIVLNPSFPADELERYVRREKTSLIQLRTNPGFLARERFNRAVYGDFPAAILAPTVDSLQKVKPDVLKEFHQAHYAPNNAIMGFAGDITVEQATALAKKYFGQWKNHPLPTAPSTSVASVGPAKIFLVDRPGSVQSNILAGGLSLRRADPDEIPLEVANRVLGGGSAARLFMNLREEKGYTYGAYSRVTSSIYPGTFAANTEVRNPVTDGSLHELMYEFKRLRDEKVPQAELDEAKRSIVSSFALSLENPAFVLGRWMDAKYYSLPADYWDHYSDEVAKVTADTVQRMAKKYIDLDHLQIVVVGDAKDVREAVSKYGTVQVFDSEGKPVEVKAGAAASSGK
jgi:zinc protease